MKIIIKIFIIIALSALFISCQEVNDFVKQVKKDKKTVEQMSETSPEWSSEGKKADVFGGFN